MGASLMYRLPSYECTEEGGKEDDFFVGRHKIDHHNGRMGVSKNLGSKAHDYRFCTWVAKPQQSSIMVRMSSNNQRILRRGLRISVG